MASAQLMLRFGSGRVRSPLEYPTDRRSTIPVSDLERLAFYPPKATRCLPGDRAISWPALGQRTADLADAVANCRSPVDGATAVFQP